MTSKTKLSLSIAMALSMAMPLAALAADSFKVEAESFVDLGGTFDDQQEQAVSIYTVDGQAAINYVNHADYVDYLVDVTSEGMYEVTFYAGTDTADNTAIELLVEEQGVWVSYAQAQVPAMGWDHFQALTAETPVKLSAGTQKLRIYALGSNDWQWNLESFELVRVGDLDDDGGANEPSGSIKVEAESFIAQAGSFDDNQPSPVSIYQVADQEAINYINRGDSTDYQVHITDAGMYDISFNVGTAITENSEIEVLIYENNQWVSYARVSVPAYGWDNFTELNAVTQLKLPAGNQKLRIHAVGSNDWQWNLESFTLVWAGDISIDPGEPNDADNDGVEDGADLCAGTPANEAVNAVGCAESQLDDDNDGIKNNVDACPDTAPGATVDFTGCAIPTGVIDVNTADPDYPSFVSFNNSTPQGKRWQKVTSLSDEFEYWDDEKWVKTYWNYGSTPVNMMDKNAGVEDGNLWIRATLDADSATQWFETARVRSTDKIKFPMYTESRIKVANISAYSTFWLNNGDINNRDEIDIIEINPTPTRSDSAEHQHYPWQMNSQYFIAKNGNTERNKGNSDNRWDLSDGNTLKGVVWNEAYHVFGAWWKDEHTVQFYLNGEAVNSVTTVQAFSLEQFIIWDLWTQDSPWVGGLPAKQDLLDNTNNVMKVDWVRTWKLVDE